MCLAVSPFAAILRYPKVCAIDAFGLIQPAALREHPMYCITSRDRWSRCLATIAIAGVVLAVTSNRLSAQQASISAWDAADFRIWGYIPYWATSTQINNFATNGMYGHVSDV